MASLICDKGIKQAINQMAKYCQRTKQGGTKYHTQARGHNYSKSQQLRKKITFQVITKEMLAVRYLVGS